MDPRQVRELPALIITKVAVGPYDNNCYVLRCRDSGVQLLVDAADAPDVLLDLVGPDGLAQWSPHTRTVTTGRRFNRGGRDHRCHLAHPLDAKALPIGMNRSGRRW